MNLRDQRQDEFAEEWIRKGMFGVLYLCPRFGKIYTTINILQKRPEMKKILIAYPDTKIRDSWVADFKKRGYDDSNVTYTTYVSLKKYAKESYNLIILDEIHLISPAQILQVVEFKRRNMFILGLTGTLTAGSKRWLLTNLHLPVTVTYTMAQGIKEGIVADYEITVVKTPLDIYIKKEYGKQLKTEKQQFNTLTFLINSTQAKGNDASFFRLQRMRIIQKSLAKQAATIKLIRNNFRERILVFCGVTDIADNLEIPSYHSKSSEKKIFEDFAKGRRDHLAVIKIGNTGVTYKPLNRVIINYFDSNAENMAQKINRCMSMEYDNPDKKAHIIIVSSTEEIELAWLSKALEFFDKSKIKYL